MTKDVLQSWFDGLLNREAPHLMGEIIVWGECKRHLGPTWAKARARLRVEPSDRFMLVEDVHMGVEFADYAGSFLHGVLDILMIDDRIPLNNIRIVISDLSTDQVESSRAAFREAGRDAGRKAVEELSAKR